MGWATCWLKEDYDKTHQRWLESHEIGILRCVKGIKWYHDYCNKFRKLVYSETHVSVSVIRPRENVRNIQKSVCISKSFVISCNNSRNLVVKKLLLLLFWLQLPKVVQTSNPFYHRCYSVRPTNSRPELNQVQMACIVVPLKIEPSDNWKWRDWIWNFYKNELSRNSTSDLVLVYSSVFWFVSSYWEIHIHLWSCLNLSLSVEPREYWNWIRTSERHWLTLEIE